MTDIKQRETLPALSTATSVIAGVVARGAGTPSTAVPAPPVDPVLLTGATVCFGSNGLVAGLPNAPGTLSWDISNNNVRASLNGSLYITAQGVTARVQMRYYDVHDVYLGSKEGTEHIATGAGVSTFSFTLLTDTDHLMYRVDTATQIKIGAHWQDVAVMTNYMGSPSKSVDPIVMSSLQVDLGDGAHMFGVPTGFAILTWDRSNGTIRPTLSGTLYLEDAQGVTARVRMRYLDVHGNKLVVKKTPPFTAGGNGIQTTPVDMADYADNRIYQVDITTQIEVGPDNWVNVQTTSARI